MIANKRSESSTDHDNRGDGRKTQLSLRYLAEDVTGTVSECIAGWRSVAYEGDLYMNVGERAIVESNSK